MAETKKNLPRSAAAIRAMQVFYDDGHSLAEVGTRFGISPSRVEQIFRRNKIKTRGKTVSEKFRRAMDDRRISLNRETLIKLYTEENLSMAKVAGQMNVGFHAVRRNLQEYGISIRPIENYTRSRLTPEFLKTLYIDKNLTAAEIADRLGYSPLTIAKKLSKFGIKKRISVRCKSSSSSSLVEPDTNENPVNIEADETNPSSPLTAEAIAKRFGLHIMTVRQLIRNGVFPNAYRDGNGKIRRWLVPAASLENFTPRRKGRAKTSTPTAGTILDRSRGAKKQIKNSHGYDQKEVREMIELEKRGLTRTEIAIRFRLAEKIVADLLEFAALKPPRPEKPARLKQELKRLPYDSLIELYVNNQCSTKFILEKLGTNYASLYNDLRHYGIPLRSDEKQHLAEERHRTLRRMFVEENLSPEVIADRLQLTVPYVNRKLKELKLR